MAITSIKDLKTSRRIGIGWMTISIIGAMLTGLVGIAYYAKNNATLQDGNGLCNILKYFIPSVHYWIFIISYFGFDYE